MGVKRPKSKAGTVGESKARKFKTSIALTAADQKILKEMAAKIGCNRTAVIVIALRQLPAILKNREGVLL